MNMSPTELGTMSYDDNRARQFYVRATHVTNLPKKFQPDKTTVDVDAFSDAIIGLYIDKSSETHGDDSVRHQTNLGRAAFAIDFLHGVPFKDLDNSINDDKQAKKKGVIEFALGVATEGARAARGLARDQEFLRRKGEIIHPSIDEFTDLGDFIKHLAESRISPGKAQAMMLLFRLQRSSAPIEVQRQAISNICLDMKIRLNTATVHQPHSGEDLTDGTFAEGARYVKNILDSPFSLVPFKTIMELRAIKSVDPDDHESHAKEVFGHIGYVLNQLYP